MIVAASYRDVFRFVVRTWQEYEDLAVRLSSAPSILANITAALAAAVDHVPLFDLTAYMATLERACRLLLDSVGESNQVVVHREQPSALTGVVYSAPIMVDQSM